jgi:hypothetical protein
MPAACGYSYMLTEQSGLTRYRNSYRARKNYRELTLNNGICKSSLDIVKNKIIRDQRGRKHIVTEMEFFLDEMVMTITVDKSVVLIKYYQTVPGIRLTNGGYVH